MTDGKLSPAGLALTATVNAVLNSRPLPQIPEAVLPELGALAQEQKLFPMVFDALHSRWPRERFESDKRRMTLQVMSQTRATADVLALLSDAQKQDAVLFPVKGVLCRDLYPKEDLRPSGDEDLFAPTEDPRVTELLTQRGFTLTGNERGSVLTFSSAKSPLRIELHKSLFPKDGPLSERLNSLFSELRPFQYRLKSGVTVTSIHPSDHLLYLILHAYKHFIHSGFGIRQVCDVCLWSRQYVSGEELEKVLSALRSVGAERFALGVFALGEKYLGIECLPAELSAKSPDPTPMLLDLLDSGIYGSASEDRLHTATVTAGAVSGQKPSGTRRLSSALFPPRNALISRYPSLEKRPALLPLCWAHRFVSYLGHSISPGGPSPRKTLSLAQRRMELMKLYGIIDG